MEYGQSFETETLQHKITIFFKGKQIPMNLTFNPYQSLLYKIVDGKAEEIDIEFIPEEPVIRKRPAGYKAPWLVR
jgi:hypothetical protein